MSGVMQPKEESLGDKLRCAREKAGLTVEEIVNRAKMARVVVESMEANEFGFFSCPLYARSFLKQYGDYVGLDVTPWIEDLVPTVTGKGNKSAKSTIKKSDASVLSHLKKWGNKDFWVSLSLLVNGSLSRARMKFFKGLEKRNAESPSSIEQEETTPQENAPSIEEVAVVQEKKDAVATVDTEAVKQVTIVSEEK